MDFLEYSKHQMNFATILFVQTIATGAIIMWMKMSITTYEKDFGTLPFDDRVKDLVNVLWVLFGLHAT
jgi:hypothetical protein